MDTVMVWGPSLGNCAGAGIKPAYDEHGPAQQQGGSSHLLAPRLGQDGMAEQGALGSVLTFLISSLSAAGGRH